MSMILAAIDHVHQVELVDFLFQFVDRDLQEPLSKTNKHTNQSISTHKNEPGDLCYGLPLQVIVCMRHDE